MVTACKDSRFIFKVYNTDLEVLKGALPGAKLPINIVAGNGWLGQDEFVTAVLDSDLVILPHNKEFEGKLSGNLCDCVAFGVPFISGLVEPMSTMRSSMGPIGYVCDFEKRDWAEKFFNHVDREVVNQLTQAIRLFSMSYTLDRVRDDLARAIDIA